MDSFLLAVLAIPPAAVITGIVLYELIKGELWVW